MLTSRLSAEPDLRSVPRSSKFGESKLGSIQLVAVRSLHKPASLDEVSQYHLQLLPSGAARIVGQSLGIYLTGKPHTIRR